MMDKQSSPMRDLARRLLALEAASLSASPSRAHEAVRVCDKLQISLTRFAGPDGFTALMRRALALARAEVPSAHFIQLKADGSLEGLEDLAVGTSLSGNSEERGDAGAEAAIAITTHLLQILTTFVGEPITIRLVREAWPLASWNESQKRIEV